MQITGRSLTVLALILAGMVTLPGVASAANRDLLFVVDTSGSMAGARIADAKTALHTGIDALDGGQPAGLRSYAGTCGSGGVLRVPIGTGNRDQLRAETDALAAGGGTPTPDALRAGAADFAPGAPGTIILVSDGQSTCGDPCPVATELAASLGVDFRVHAVGFQAPEAAEQELQCIADSTGGQYYSADDADGLADAIGGAIGRSLKMVALGDSYSSGEGTYVYDEHHEAQKCHRGPFGWPRLFQAASQRIAEIDHRACTGAKTPQLLKQVDTAHPDPEVDLVTLTTGGNDAGFAGIISECYRPVSTCADVPASKNFQNKLRKLVTRLVVETYPAIRAAYPNAAIHHVGYPQIVPPPGTTPVNCGWLGQDEQRAAIEILGDLNFAVQEAGFRAGDVDYVNVSSALAGHELCTNGTWVQPIRGPSWAGFGTEQGHPTSNGQEALARTVALAVDN